MTSYFTYTHLYLTWNLVLLSQGGGYSHTSSIYGCAALMGGFVKNFAPMMGAFLGIHAPIMGNFFWNLSKLGVKNGYFSSKWPNFCPLWVGFAQILHLWWVHFLQFAAGVLALRASHILLRNFRASTPPPPPPSFYLFFLL